MPFILDENAQLSTKHNIMLSNSVPNLWQARFLFLFCFVSVVVVVFTSMLSS